MDTDDELEAVNFGTVEKKFSDALEEIGVEPSTVATGRANRSHEGRLRGMGVVSQVAWRGLKLFGAKSISTRTPSSVSAA